MLAYFLMFFAAALRLLPHPANFAPVAAIALFGAVYLNKRDALWLPIAAMAASDVFIGFDSITSRLTVYGSFLLIGLIGLWLRRYKNVPAILGSVLAGSVAFFLITNFALLYPPIMYPHTWQGIISSYVNGLPFFKYTLLGDVFYTAVLFGAYEGVLLWQASQKAKLAGIETSLAK